jgi:hypothetical protein
MNLLLNSPEEQNNLKRLFLFLMLAVLPLLSSCNLDGILDELNDEHDGEYPDVASVAVVNVDGSGFKILADGINAKITPDSKNIIFSNNEEGLFSIGIDGSSKTCLYKTRLINNLLVSPDGRKVAFVSDTSKTIYLINTDGSGLRALFESKPAKKILHFSEDGSKLYFVEDSTLSSVDLNGNYKTLFKNPSFSYSRALLVSPDGNSVIFFRYAEKKIKLVLRDLTTQKDSAISDCDIVEGSDTPAKFISRSTFLYMYNRTIYSYNMLNGEKKSYITIPAYSLYYYSQDGQKITYGIEMKGIYVAGIDGTSVSVINFAPETSFSYPYILSPDGKKVVFNSFAQKLAQ